MSHPQDQGALYIDRDGIPRWNGEPKFGEEWEERTWLAFDCCTGKDFKLAFPSRLRNGLTGRAWEMTKAKPDMVAKKIRELAATKDGPAKAVELIVRTTRAACEKVAPLRKHAAS